MLQRRKGHVSRKCLHGSGSDSQTLSTAKLRGVASTSYSTLTANQCKYNEPFTGLACEVLCKLVRNLQSHHKIINTEKKIENVVGFRAWVRLLANGKPILQKKT